MTARRYAWGLVLGMILILAVSISASAQNKKPNILVVWGDDIGQSNISAYTMAYWDWLLDRIFFLVPAQAYVGQFLATFKEFPPRQKAASFSLEQVMEKLQTSGGSK